MRSSTALKPVAASLRGAALLVVLASGTVHAQHLSGRFEGGFAPTTVVLFDTRGADHAPIDSARTDATGAFTFAGRRYAAGFYQLAVNDTDRVDIILDPREAEVELVFSGFPLQEHITVLRSTENQRMWEYKQVSRWSQAQLGDVQKQRLRAAPGQTALLSRLDSLESGIRAEQQRSLDRLIADDPESYFGHVVRADRALMAAVPQGFEAIRDAFGWSDARVLRSAIYSKAVMAVLQNVPPEWPDGLERGCDSVLHWSAGDPECWSYTRSLLVRLFDQYGPDHVAQYLVDAYVVGPKALHPPDDALLHTVADLLRVAVGTRAPDVRLPDPLNADTVELAVVVARNRCTALFFYSSTCDHCHAQMPGLRQLYGDLHTRGFELLGIALDADTTEFRGTLIAEGVTWPCFSELRGWGSPAAKAFGVKSTPSFFLLGPDGRIEAKPYDHAELREHVMRLLP